MPNSAVLSSLRAQLLLSFCTMCVTLTMVSFYNHIGNGYNAPTQIKVEVITTPAPEELILVKDTRPVSG